MARSKSRAKNDRDGEGQAKAKPERAKNRRAGKPQTDMRIGDISHISGRVQVAGGHIVTHEHYEEATEAKNRAEFERKELRELEASLGEMLASLQALRQTPPETGASFPLKPLELNEGRYLLGRSALVEQLVRALKADSSVFLSGRGGIGRTSLLQAGLMPRLLEQGHLPLLVSLSEEEPGLTVKRSLHRGIASTTVLKGWGLAAFLEHAAKCVPGDGQLVLLLDGFEHAGALEDFHREWLLTRSNPRLRWLFSIDRGFTARLAPFQPDEVLEVPPLDRPAAAQAIRRLEQDGLTVEEAYLDEILNELSKHRGATPETGIHPGDLQVVLKALAEDGSSRRLSKVYEQQEGVSGIFERHLVRAVDANLNFSPSQRPVVWQILSFLGEEYGTPVSAVWIRSRLNEYGLPTQNLPELLRRLRTLHIIRADQESFELAHVHLMRGIRKHLDKETLRARVHAQSLEQLNNIRASALRGLLAGAVGLAVFRRIVADPIPDLAANVWVTLLFAPAGGLAGLLLTFCIDVFIARYRSTRPWLRYLISAATGLVTFALALALYVYLEEHGGDTLAQFLLAMVAGGAWGIVAGAGIAWILSSQQVQAWKIPVVALSSAFTLYVSNLLFSVLNRATPLEVLLGGFWFPLVIIAATVLWRAADPFASYERST